MKKTVKQMIAVLLTMLLVCSVMPLAFAYTVSSGTVGSLTWTLDSNGTLTVSGNGAMPVMERFPWETYKSQVKSLTIGTGVTEIAEGAFWECKNLTNVSIPNTVGQIDGLAFAGCTALTDLVIPSSVKTIGVDCFRECKNLRSVSLNYGLEKLEWRAFYSCSKLRTISIPGSLKEFDSEVFKDCEELTSATIENGIREIGKFAFWGCTNLRTLNLPSSLKVIKPGAFWKCQVLNNVTLPEGLQEIDVAAFSECFALDSITIPKSTTLVDYMSFNGCTAMRDFKVLNPSCILNDPFEQAPEDKAAQIRLDYIWSVPAYSHYKLTVYGYAGSTAETYAKATNKSFVVMEGEPAADGFLAKLKAAFSNLLAMLKPLLDNVINALKGLFGAVNSNPQQPADPQQPTQPAQSGSETSQTIDAAGLLSKLAEMFRSLLAQLLQANATATV